MNNAEKISEEIEQIKLNTRDEIEAFKAGYLGKKGAISSLMSGMKSLSVEEKKERGQLVNKLKQQAEQKLQEARAKLEELQLEKEAQPKIDLSLPAPAQRPVGAHPITRVRAEMEDIFERIGFSKAYGNEIEDDFHNFSALNFPENHPAREMQDTYFLDEEKNYLLRTHTSSVQVRLMETETPPIRAIMPGRVFRNEAVSARSHTMFHQIEGLYIDKEVSFKDLKATLLYFAKEFFGAESNIRLRPSYFPFTEPSCECDVVCFICGGKGCNVCKYSGWVEIAGAGLVDPNVLKASGIDPSQYAGFAFGMGVERTAMLRYQISDIRLFLENDVRFLSQFASF